MLVLSTVDVQVPDKYLKGASPHEAGLWGANVGDPVVGQRNAGQGHSDVPTPPIVPLDLFIATMWVTGLKQCHLFPGGSTAISGCRAMRGIFCFIIS